MGGKIGPVMIFFFMYDRFLVSRVLEFHNAYVSRSSNVVAGRQQQYLEGCRAVDIIEICFLFFFVCERRNEIVKQHDRIKRWMESTHDRKRLRLEAGGIQVDHMCLRPSPILHGNVSILPYLLFQSCTAVADQR